MMDRKYWFVSFVEDRCAIKTFVLGGRIHVVEGNV
jgi:hypothetical protein